MSANLVLTISHNPYIGSPNSSACARAHTHTQLSLGAFKWSLIPMCFNDFKKCFQLLLKQNEF